MLHKKVHHPFLSSKDLATLVEITYRILLKLWQGTVQMVSILIIYKLHPNGLM